MLRTRLCELFGIEFPIIQAAMGPVTSAELVAAVSNGGGLGSLGAVERSAEDLRKEMARIRELTDAPFAVNFLVSRFDEEAFAVTIEARPAVISLALGDPGKRMHQAQDRGILVMHQIHTVEQARIAAERGVDVIIAQGTEAGGNCGEVGALALIPQVVDAVAPVPVVAAGGIADGRGLAAALVLGAEGVNMGTRFLASEEARCGDDWKRALLAAQSEDAVKVEFWNSIFPRAGEGSYEATPRALRTPFIDRWRQSPERAAEEADELRNEVLTAAREGRMHEYVPLTGQTAGMIHEILPAAEIVRSVAADAVTALERAAQSFVLFP
jgi:enoyl-[acyl-carrier protein] reductase II